MSKPPALPTSLPGGEIMPHMSARMRTQIVDTVFEMTGGVERMADWASKPENYGEFITKVWGKGTAKAVSHELGVSEGVEALWDRLDREEAARTIEGRCEEVS